MRKLENDIPDEERRIKEPPFKDKIECSLSEASLDALSSHKPLGPYLKDLMVMVDKQGQRGKRSDDYIVGLFEALTVFENDLYKNNRARRMFHTIGYSLMLIASIFGKPLGELVVKQFQPAIKSELPNIRTESAAKIP